MASGVALVLSAIVALSVYLVADFPDDYLADSFAWTTALFVLAAVPIALLFAWGEIDLSFIGTLTFGAYIYVQVGDSGIAAHLLVALLFGLAAGAATGLVRYLTRVPSAFLTFVVGLLWIAITGRLAVSELDEPTEGQLTGLALPVALAAVSAGVAFALALARPLRDVGTDGRSQVDAVDPRVIIGFAISGGAGALFGDAVASASRGMQAPGLPPILPGTGSFAIIFGAVAVAGVVRGAGVIAPVVAVLGTVLVALVGHSAVFVESWKPEDGSLLLMGLIVVTLALSHGLVRAMGSDQGRRAGGSPPPGLAAAAPASAPAPTMPPPPPGVGG